MLIKDIRRDCDTKEGWGKGTAANGTALPLMNCCLTLLEAPLVRRNTNTIWSTMISSLLFQKRTKKLRVVDNLHYRNDDA